MTPARRSNSTIMHRAGVLRREPTAAESRLWAHFRGRRLEGMKFRRQHAIGPYVVDFCSPGKKLVVELDGGQHLGQEELDAERTRYLESKGYRVIRFWNDQVINDIDGVLSTIMRGQETRERFAYLTPQLASPASGHPLHFQRKWRGPG